MHFSAQSGMQSYAKAFNSYFGAFTTGSSWIPTTFIQSELQAHFEMTLHTSSSVKLSDAHNK
jgi:hypothetical protein